mgnify:CR=1 FL=1|tara:strand:- start:4459 stop:5391 length:933 start_codon:yes stop_codon:yes gene_type:complete
MKPIILGLYGLSKNHKNTSGYEVVKSDDALNILKTAWGRGIRFLDTAPSYGRGNADYLIKEMRKLNYDFKLISKLGLDVQSNKFCDDKDLIKKELFNLRNNHGDNVHSVLLHSPTKNFISKNTNLHFFFDNAKSILGDQVNIGISLREPGDSIYLDSFQHDLLIESNLSWFDLRILKYLNSKNKSKFKIIARSIFASGIINIICDKNQNTKFSDHDIRSSWNINNLLNENKSDIERINKVKNILKTISLSEIGFSLFPLLSPFLFGIIVGPLTQDELFDSETSYKKKIPKNIENNLRNIVNELNPILFER